MRRLSVELSSYTTILELLPVTIDFRQTLEERILAANLTRVGQDITSTNFPSLGSGIVTRRLSVVHFPLFQGDAKTRQVLNFNGQNFASLDDLVAYSAVRPEVPSHVIAAIGSGIFTKKHGHRLRLVPTLSKSLTDRDLTTYASNPEEVLHGVMMPWHFLTYYLD